MTEIVLKVALNATTLPQVSACTTMSWREQNNCNQIIVMSALHYTYVLTYNLLLY